MLLTTKRTYFLFPIFALFLATGCTQVKPPSKVQIPKGQYSAFNDSLDAFIQNELQRHKIAGLSVAVTHKDNIIFNQHYGYADISSRTLVGDHTRFRAGSLAKFVNAIVVMDLVQSGALSLDTAITHYLPELTTANTNFKDITLRHLLSHQSGLPSDLIKGMWTQTPQNYSYTLTYLSRIDAPLTPNQHVLYSNLAYNLVGEIISRATKTPYTQYMNNRLAYWGMANSAFSASPSTPKTAQSYERKRARKEFALRDVPAAGLTTTAKDMATLYSRIFSDSIIGVDKEFLAENMFQDYSSHLPSNFGKRVGLGVFFMDGIFHTSQPIYGHTGATVNHRGLLKFSFDNNYGVVLLSNDRSAFPALHRIANQALYKIHEVVTGRRAPKPHYRWPLPSDTIHVDPQQLVGHYASKVGLIKITRHNYMLKAKLAGKTFSLYQRKPGGLYYLRYKLFGLFPIDLGYLNNLGFSVDGDYLLSTNTAGVKQLMGEKIYPTPIPEVWRTRIGKYDTINPLSVMKLRSGGIKLKDGFLIAYAKTEEGDKLQFALEAVDENKAKVLGIGRGLGEYIYVEKDQNSDVLNYSNLRFRKKNQ